MIIIGEKINGSIPAVKRAIAAKDADFIRNLAQAQAEVGVDYIDVCAAVDTEIEVETLEWLIGLVQEVTAVPVAIDSPSAAACVEAIKFCKKPGLINSVSLEGDKIEIVFPVIADTEWGCVALLCDDAGIPKSAGGRLEIFAKTMAKARKNNIVPSRLHIDPLVEMLCTSENGIKTIVEVIKEIKKQYPSIYVTGAVSNVSFNLPARRLINQAFAVLAINAGMDSVIMDPLNGDLLGMIYATEALLGNDEYCMRYIGAYRKSIFGSKIKYLKEKF